MVMQKKMDEINTKTSNQDLIHQSKPKPTSTDHFLQPQVRAQAQARRPRGFAATAETMGSRNNKKVTEVTGTTPKTTVISNKGKREREKEKERAKLRERHRRAITTRMLAGLRQYGDFSLPARADMNDVLAALAREAGWIVETDGTTFRHSPPPHNMLLQDVRSEDHGNDYMGSHYVPVFVMLSCFDKYLQTKLQKAAELRGHTSWARGPDNAGQYNSLPHETGFFCERGDYDSCYGRFFLHWYTYLLIEHADNLLSLIRMAFEETKIIVKILNAAWDRGLTIAGENEVPCYDREGCMRIVEMAKPRNNPDGRHLSFMYQQASPLAQETEI